LTIQQGLQASIMPLNFSFKKITGKVRIFNGRGVSPSKYSWVYLSLSADLEAPEQLFVTLPQKISKFFTKKLGKTIK
jgi:hypothetical protein